MDRATQAGISAELAPAYTRCAEVASIEALMWPGVCGHPQAPTYQLIKPAAGTGVDSLVASSGANTKEPGESPHRGQACVPWFGATMSEMAPGVLTGAE